MQKSSKKGIINAAATLLSCAVLGIGAIHQSKAFGAETQIPQKTLDGEAPAVQESKFNVPLTELQVTVHEYKSLPARQPTRHQRRRKPKMAAVPIGTPILVQDDAAVAQVESQEAQKARLAIQPGEDKSGVAAKLPIDGVSRQGIAVTAEGVARPDESEAEESDPFATSVAKKQVAEIKPATTGKKRYQLAPIKWGARVTETLTKMRERHNEAKLYGDMKVVTLENDRRSFYNTQTAEIKGSTYVLQPYIAQIEGNLGIVKTREKRTTNTFQDEKQITNDQASLRHHKFFGNGSVSLFNRSRFPFSASFNVTNADAKADYINSNSDTKSVFLQQQYRPARGPERYNASYQHVSSTAGAGSSQSSAVGSEAQKSSYSALQGSYSTKLGAHQMYPFSALYRHSETLSSSSSGNMTADILTAQHTYLPPESLLAISSTGAFTASRQDRSGNSQSAQFVQLNSTVSWQPESEDIPLFLTGTGRFFDASTSTFGTKYSTKTYGINGSALWDESHNLKYHGDASVMRSESDSSSSLTTVQRARAVYRADDVKIRKASYYWNANGGLFNQTQSGGTPSTPTGVSQTGSTNLARGTNTRGFGGVGHSLSGGWDTTMLGRVWPMRYAANQDLSTNVPITEFGKRVSPTMTSLRNNVSLSTNYEKNQWSFLSSVSFTDLKTWGGNNPVHTKVVAFNLGGRGRQPIYEGYGAKVDGTMQIARSTKGRIQASGALIGTYLKHGVFGIRGLSYSVRTNFETRPVPPIEQPLGDTPGIGNVTRERAISYGINQNLMYRLGMNELRLAALFEEKRGIKRATLMAQFKIWRTVGN